MGGDQSSKIVGEDAEWTLGLVRAKPDLTLAEIQSELRRRRRLEVSIAAVWRFLDKHGLRFKKTLHAAEQERPDVAATRLLWRERQPLLDPERLIFIEETPDQVRGRLWVTTNMARRCGWAPRGKRLIAGVPYGHWKTTTFVAGLRCDGIIAPCVIDGPMIVMDNLSSHKVCGVEQAITARKAVPLYLPPYSPDLNPVENAFAKLKALLRAAAERTVDSLWDRIGSVLHLFTSAECRNYFQNAGYA
jgi:hypothetical protein